MDFQQARQEYLRLREQYQDKKITAEALEQSLHRLVVEDDAGTRWQIGPLSGCWYRQEGNLWVEAQPPDPSENEPLPPLFTAADFRAAAEQKRAKVAVWGAGTATVAGTAILLANFLCLLSLASVLLLPRPVAVAQATLAPTVTASAVVVSATSTPIPPTPEEGTPLASRSPEPAAFTITPGRKTPTGEAGQTTLAWPSETPTQTLPPTPESQAPVRVWKSISFSTFRSEDDLSSEWAAVLDYTVETRYLSYRGLPALLLTYYDDGIEVFPDYESADFEIADIDIRETLAFPGTEETATVEILCRYMDLDNTYSLSVSRNTWLLSRWLEGEQTEMLTGAVPANIRNGDWGRWQLRCIGSSISVLLNGSLLGEVQDNSLPEGSWEVVLYIDPDYEKSAVYLTNHQVYKLVQNEAAELQDVIQAGDLYLTFKRSWRTAGNQAGLGLMMENLGARAVTIQAESIYLEGPDGQRVLASSTAPSGAAGTPLAFPLSLAAGSSVDGDVYFAVSDRSNWALVVDLTALGLGQARFVVPPN